MVQGLPGLTSPQAPAAPAGPPGIPGPVAPPGAVAPPGPPSPAATMSLGLGRLANPVGCANKMQRWQSPQGTPTRPSLPRRVTNISRILWFLAVLFQIVVPLLRGLAGILLCLVVPRHLRASLLRDLVLMLLRFCGSSWTCGSSGSSGRRSSGLLANPVGCAN